MSSDVDRSELEQMREQWSESAQPWNKWWRVFEEGAQSINEHLVELAQLAPGNRVLDLATGLGEPAVTAAQRVGPRGSVVGLDLAAPMLGFASERARAAGLANLACVQGDAQQLPFADRSFDAALSRWGVMLVPEPRRAISEARRVIRDGARFAAAVWSFPERVPMIAIAGRVAIRELGLEPPPPDAPGPLRMGRPGRLEEELEGAGLREVRGESIRVTFEYASAQQYVAMQRELSGMLRKELAKRDAATAERLSAALVREISAYAGPDGRIRLDNEVHLAVGTR
jgi:SAM-dependent methyltransferase